MRRNNAAAPVWFGALLLVAQAHCGCQAEQSGTSRVMNAASRVVDLGGAQVAPLTEPAQAHVLVFLRIDCPISNRYAPELTRLAAQFEPRGVRFTLVYADRDETPALIAKHLDDFSLKLRAVRDLDHALVRKSGVTRTPEVAVFDRAGALAYRGRIDDTWVSFGRARVAPTRRDLALAVEATLAGRAPAVDRTEAVGCPIPKLWRAP